MLSTVAQSVFLRFSTDDLPEHERAEAVRTNPLSLVAWEALPGPHVRLHCTRRQLPGLSLLMAAADGVRYERTRRHLADGNVDLALQVNLTGGAALYGRGRELVLRPGHATLTTHPHP